MLMADEDHAIETLLIKIFYMVLQVDSVQIFFGIFSLKQIFKNIHVIVFDVQM